jgi:hypothetical protein
MSCRQIAPAISCTCLLKSAEIDGSSVVVQALQYSMRKWGARFLLGEKVDSFWFVRLVGWFALLTWLHPLLALFSDPASGAHYFGSAGQNEGRSTLGEWKASHRGCAPLHNGTARQH